jgi:hypothetical protein
MVDIDKLDSVINELDSSSKSILKLPDLINSSELVLAKATENALIIDSLVKGINEAKEKSIQASERSEKAYKIIDEYCNKSAEVNASFIRKVNTLLLEMRNENTELYRNFEASINSKFELFKSDIVVENRKIVDETTKRVNDNIDRIKSDMTAEIIKNSNEVLAKTGEKIDRKTKLLFIAVIISALISLTGLIILCFK